MRETTVRFHSFLTMDAKAREAALDRMARSGWALTHIYWNLFARFQRTERTDLAYFVDWTDPSRPDEADYRQLCADAGWEPVQALRYETVYASRPGADPAPIQTDPALEYRRFRKKVLRRMALSGIPALFLLLLLLLVVLLRPGNLRGLLLELASGSNLLALLLITAPAALPALAVYLADGALHLLAWRRAAEAGGPLPSPTPCAARLGGVLHALARLLLYLTLPVLASDLLLNSSVSLFNLAVCVLAAFVGVAVHRGGAELRRQLPGGIAAILVLALLIWGHGPLREVWPGRVPAARVLDFWEVQGEERSDTFLGSRAEWWEFPPETDSDAYLRVTADAWALPLLAELGREPTPEDYRPVEGLEGVWQRIDDHSWDVLLYRDRMEVHFTYQYPASGPDLDLISHALAWAGP